MDNLMIRHLALCCVGFLLACLPVPVTEAQQSNKKVYADQYQSQEADVGAAVTAAHAALTNIGGVQSGVISLEGYRGTLVLKTPIVLDSHSVSLVGPGKNILTLDCQVTSGDCIRIRDKNFGQGGWVHGPHVSGFSLIGHRNANVVGIHIGDVFRLHLEDVIVFGFTGDNDIGILFDNNVGYTEQLNMTDVQVSNNTTGMHFTSQNAVGQQSYGYGNYLNVFVQVGAGQTGLSIDGGTPTTRPLIYHSRINWIFEDLRHEPGQTNTFIKLEDNAALLDNSYAIFMEDQGGNGGPGIKMGNNSSIKGFGHIQSWGRSVTLGSNVVFNVVGMVEISESDWSPVWGHVGLDSKWGSGASAGNFSGQWQFFTFTITAGGNPGTNPGITISFPVASSVNVWRYAPLYMCKQVGGSGTLGAISGENTANLTSMQLRFNGNPNPGSTYIINCQGAAR